MISRAKSIAVAAAREVLELLDTSSVDEPQVDHSFEAERQRRRADEYLVVIQSLERQRDEWKEMFHKQARAHVTAQAMLEKVLIRTRQVAARAIIQLNTLRKEKDLKPVESPQDLSPYDGEPVGLAKSYAKEMKELHDAIPAPICWRESVEMADRRYRESKCSAGHGPTTV